MKETSKTSNKSTVNKYLRLGIQVVFFILFPSVYSSCFAGAKYIFSQIGAGEKVVMTSFVAILITMCVYTIVFGRFFCGFACAFGSLGDWIYGIRLAALRKLGRKPGVIPDTLIEKLSIIKYIISAAILILCAIGVYGKLHGSSPWDVFSKLITLNVDMKGYWIGFTILIAIMIGMFFRERFFCKVLCPMGAIFSLLPSLPLFALRRNRTNCIKGCSACTRKCPVNVELPEIGSKETTGECIQCQKCIGTCPKQNINCGYTFLKGNEIWFTLFRALILVLLFISLGI